MLICHDKYQQLSRLCIGYLQFNTFYFILPSRKNPATVMAYFRKTASGWRAEIEKFGVRDSRCFALKSEAIGWANRREIELEEDAGRKVGKHTLHEAIDRYSKDVSPKRKGCLWEQVRLKRFKKELDDLRLDRVTPDIIGKWRDHGLKGSEEKKPKQPSSVRRDMELLRSVFEIARREWKWTTTNPVAEAKKPPTNPHRTRTIAPDEAELVCIALGYSETKPIATKRQQTAVAFLIALETGMRAGEVLRAKVSGKVARLDTTKNGQPREVPLSKRAQELFSRVKVFTVESHALDTNFRMARKKAGLSGFTFHDSRHTACTRLAKILDPMTLAKVLGHRDLKHTLIYYNPTTDEIADRLG